MTVFDGRRIPSATFKLDVERMQRGWYSDKYFGNIVGLLEAISSDGQRLEWYSEDSLGARLNLTAEDIGNMHVEMQFFTRRSPYALVIGVDKALAMLRECTGYFDEQGRFVNTFDQMEVHAVQDGFIAQYSGDPLQVTPVIRVRGRYRDFAMLETPVLGALTRGSRVATNVYETLRAANGKTVLFFPARFDAHEVQAADGYAYNIAVQLFNQNYAKRVGISVSTDEQGSWWGGLGGGTIAHAAIATFLGDTVAVMMAFARHRPAEIPRIALVDFHNDCVGDSVRVMTAMFRAYRECVDAGQLEEAEKFRLYGVRPDTSGTLRDRSVQPLGDPRLDLGVVPRLVFNMREAIDAAWEEWELPSEWVERAQEWCRQVRIVVSGGFKPDKIRQFERLGVPVDVYAVGSYLFQNSSEDGTNTDFTSDIVRVQLDGEW
ncbi:MAG: nicotinate phosphoribosyltransferase, partial [Chloroflexota bacterium]|nr:nicotinate phosphoribosyltransferase [Chloroflexota bacterium]